jgi:hypothetical protein
VRRKKIVILILSREAGKKQKSLTSSKRPLLLEEFLSEKRGELRQKDGARQDGKNDFHCCERRYRVRIRFLSLENKGYSRKKTNFPKVWQSLMVRRSAFFRNGGCGSLQPVEVDG